MTSETRNQLFLQYQNLIGKTIRRNRRLIAALWLETEDVAQDLSIVMLLAIEKFDPLRSDSLPAFLVSKLQFAILDIRRRHKPYGMGGTKPDTRPEYTYLNKVSDSGMVCEIPSYDDTGTFEVSEFLSNLTEFERNTLNQKVGGYSLKKKSHTAALADMRCRFEQFYTTSALSK